MAAIGAALASEHPRTNGGWTMRLVPVGDLIGGDGFWVVIALFLLSIGLLMAIATANVSNLVHGADRSRARASWRCAPRSAPGSGRLVRQFVTEGLVLSLAGALRVTADRVGRAAGHPRRVGGSGVPAADHRSARAARSSPCSR